MFGNLGYEISFLLYPCSVCGIFDRFGAVLDNLKDRQDSLGKIKGCIVDSGGDPTIDPKVYVRFVLMIEFFALHFFFVEKLVYLIYPDGS